MNQLDLKNALIERAKSVRSGARVLLTEGEDPRALEAAKKISELNLAEVTLLTSKDEATGGFISTHDQSYLARIEQAFRETKKGSTLSEAELHKTISNPLYFGALCLKLNLFDTVISGAIHTTADVFRAGVHCLGPAAGISTASSLFHMFLKDGRALTYADCGVIPDPNPEQLADIAISSAENHRKFTGQIPKVAMLSFSTKGSAKHSSLDKVIKATKLVKERQPTLIVDGEMQFDAAFVPEVSQKKSPQSPLAGEANVFIFPDLNSGNIAYKITERIGGAIALGPIIQGLSRSWMDLSRGCNADDIVYVSAIGLLMSS